MVSTGMFEDSKWVDVDGLVGLGAQGLVDAARRFDAGRGVPFAAYARPRTEL
jgi:DNA-directed RNA polymerase specialized sigma subunit